MTAAALTDPRPGPEEARPVFPAPRRRTDAVRVGLVVALAVVATVLVVAPVPEVVRAVVVGVALVLVPGAVVVRRLGITDGWAAAGLTLTSSLTVASVVALVCVWTGFWHPVAVGSAMLIVTAAAYAVVVRRRPSPAVVTIGAAAQDSGDGAPASRPLATAAVVTLVLATVLWAVGLLRTSTEDLGDWGLVSAFSPLWYAAVALSLVTLLVLVTARRAVHAGLLAAHAGLLTLMLYGSAAIIEAEPRLPWVYKHIAVVRYIEANGSLDSSIDIYQRWPGFFALAAQAAELIGLPDPVDWAWVAEPGFALVDVVLVVALVRTLTTDRRTVWTATTFFVISNWIAQNYFAPQALAYALHLSVLLLLLLGATGGRAARLGRWAERVAGRLVPRARRSTTGEDEAGGRGLPVASAVLLLVMFAVVVVSHQLTPYLTLLGVVPLFVLHYLRPRWVPAAMLVVALGYLAINLTYIQDHFGLFSGFDPIANATYTPTLSAARIPAAEWQARLTRAIAGVMVLLALVGVVRRARQGRTRQALVVAWLMLSPGLVLAGQTYGGEGRLRVYLFALPWLSLAAAWAFLPVERRPTRLARAALAAAVVGVTTMFVLSYFQPEAQYRTDPGQIATSRWLDANVQPDDAVVFTSLAGPGLIGPRYPYLLEAVNLPDVKQYYPDPLTLRDVQEVAYGVRPSDSYRTLVVFLEQGFEVDVKQGYYAPGEERHLEDEIARSPSARLVFADGGNHVYELR